MISRRQILQLSAGVLAWRTVNLPATEDPAAVSADTLPLIRRPVPSSGELLPVIGMGTSRTFDTDGNEESINPLHK